VSICGGMPTPDAADVPALLRRAAAAMRVALDADQIDKLRRFVELLLLWNGRMSLVSQHTVAEIITKHVQDSFAIEPLVPPKARVADLGSGGGFPGIVLAITCPNTT